MMNARRCLIIPAIKKNAAIPDQLVKKLAGKTLIQRALDTARQVAQGEDILVVTDSDEIRLICRRNGVGCAHDPAIAVRSLNIIASLKPVLEDLAERYEDLIIYRAVAPLLGAEDIEDAHRRFSGSGSDCLLSVRSLRQRTWREEKVSLQSLLEDAAEQTVQVEIKALVMLRSSLFRERAAGDKVTVMPYFLNDRGLEINSYQDWWICEKLLRRKRIVFVVAGYPAIGLGHVFRALMLAHEISDHQISFLCTRESEQAAAGIAARDYRTRVQDEGDLARNVLALRPHLVINDFLDTGEDYIRALREKGCLTVNFEDGGPGAALADLVINALYAADTPDRGRFLCGHRYFCLRDEFLQAERNIFRRRVGRVLITFGGTDPSGFTQKTLDVLYPECLALGILLRVVVGPGYAGLPELARHVQEVNREAEELQALGFLDLPLDSGPFVSFSHATNVMSRMMEGVDLAVCAAGRTVFELAHMRVPGIVLAHHAREDAHSFARPRNGFIYLGFGEEFDEEAVEKACAQFLDASLREEFFQRLSRFDFTGNKVRVVRRILDLLELKADAP
ncbi:MAG: cytidine 5'-phosphate N-acetylneuraminic acid synthetase [Deltaproteobacteria bacterium]|jgi:spore coat polysaccharide biosynthesis predicted glycosyltransferase SpsG/CMP-N-acetylneuraminic acid synthetase|nr:cytidine 5'-phosphate N-acetylneuraminic acid synthetase [Deltaproteobacteria bacterium]